MVNFRSATTNQVSISRVGERFSSHGAPIAQFNFALARPLLRFTLGSENLGVALTLGCELDAPAFGVGENRGHLGGRGRRVG